MEAKPDQRLLRMREAIAEFCDAGRVQLVIEIESRLSDAMLNAYGLPRLRARAPDPEPPPLVPIRPGMGDPDYRAIKHNWNLLDQEFKDLIADEKLFVSGMVGETGTTSVRANIPAAMVVKFILDYRNNTFGPYERRYQLVRVSTSPYGQARPPTAAPITAANVRHLSDDELFSIIEEYARRVVEEEGSKLELPVKVSFIPIIRRMMEHRAKTGEICGTLAAEAKVLAAWIETKVSGHQTPKPGSIENELRENYWRLKP